MNFTSDFKKTEHFFHYGTPFASSYTGVTCFFKCPVFLRILYLRALEDNLLHYIPTQNTTILIDAGRQYRRDLYRHMDRNRKPRMYKLFCRLSCGK